MRRRLLGTEHPDIASSLNNVAYVLLQEGILGGVEEAAKVEPGVRSRLDQ